MTNLDSILKSRDITLLTKVCQVKAMVFPVVMYGCESWTIKKAACHKNTCFWTVVLEKNLGSPLYFKEIKPVYPKGYQSWYSLEGLMLKLNLQYFGHLMRRADSLEKFWCWKGLGTGGEGDNRGWDGWMASPTRWTWVWVNSRSWWWPGRPGVLQFMGLQRVGTEQLNWTELSHQGNPYSCLPACFCSKWILDFIKWVSCTYGVNHKFFLIYLLRVVKYIDLCPFVQPILYSWTKPHLYYLV